ncbi:MAG: MBL fold metallo-hydrolase, partial [Thermomicrobia bacterium]|nr:MBL fold metallo-hydrolase [Thermomicrobia bacterium]
LWDCISLIDDPTIAAVRALGGIAAIAISHPHFYSSMVEWSRAFAAPVYLHADDRQWVMRPDDAIVFWEGETHPLVDGVTLIRCGGHFAGSTALHWAAGAEGRGALLTGDTIQVVSDRRFVTFMYSYPNSIPLPAATIRRIVAAVEPFPFETLYGGWWDRIVTPDAKGAVTRSAERYIAKIAD